MKKLTFVSCLLLFANFFVLAQDGIEVSHVVGTLTYKQKVEFDAVEVDIVNQTESSGSVNNDASMLVSITGLEKLKKLKVLNLSYFKYIGAIDLSNTSVTTLVVKFSEENNKTLQKYFSMNLRAVVFQACSLKERPVVNLNRDGLDYLEFSNCQLSQLPVVNGKIRIINLIYNQIEKITTADWIPY
jgi:hypothetical protein